MWSLYNLYQYRMGIFPALGATSIYNTDGDFYLTRIGDFRLTLDGCFCPTRTSSPFECLCCNFILPETGKQCLLFYFFQFAQLIIPYLIMWENEKSRPSWNRRTAWNRRLTASALFENKKAGILEASAPQKIPADSHMIIFWKLYKYSAPFLNFPRKSKKPQLDFS